MRRQFLFLTQKLHIADNGGKRRLDIMGYVCYQIHLHALALHALCKRSLHALLYLIQVIGRLP